MLATTRLLQDYDYYDRSRVYGDIHFVSHNQDPKIHVLEWQ